MQVLCQLTKSCPIGLIRNHLPALITMGQALGNDTTFMQNALLRQLRVKLVSRSLIRLLPTRNRTQAVKGGLVCLKRWPKLTMSPGLLGQKPVSAEDDQLVYEGADVPEVVDDVLGDLFNAMQDKVRDRILAFECVHNASRSRPRSAGQQLKVSLASPSDFRPNLPTKSFMRLCRCFRSIRSRQLVPMNSRI
jgi:hypothetical protein